MNGQSSSPLCSTILVILLGSFVTFSPSSSSAESALFTRYWEADRVEERELAAQNILKERPSFDALYQELADGRSYVKDVETGRLELDRKDSRGRRHPYIVLVPEDYDPAARYRVRFYLHGGVNRGEFEKGDVWWRRVDRFEPRKEISVFPASWRASLWWQPSQIENLQAILDRLKLTYNLDENRVYLFGVSDGGTGAYYHAFKAPTLWAGFLPFIGHPAVLANPGAGVVDEMFVVNLVNKPFYIVNGETDRLYPVRRVRPLIEQFERAGVDLVFRPQPSGHNTRWWNAESEAIDAFIEAHPRKPHPEHLVWETENVELFPRLHWLWIDELGPAKGESELLDFDNFPEDSDGPGRTVIEIFPHEIPPGRVELSRKGNQVTVKTRGVKTYTLLLSPDAFDLTEPVLVTTNGSVSFQGKVEPSPETLLKWAARDNDRTMLYAAELTIRLP